MATDYKLIGVPCGQHGPYTFYKAFKYRKNGKANILALSEFFFVKMWSDNDLISIGELQLLWEDKNTEQTLASLRLYILPENTPDGRQDFHGEDEVLAITEKVVLRVEDLLTCLADAASDWSWGHAAADCGISTASGSGTSTASTSAAATASTSGAATASTSAAATATASTSATATASTSAAATASTSRTATASTSAAATASTSRTATASTSAAATASTSKTATASTSAAATASTSRTATASTSAAATASTSGSGSATASGSGKLRLDRVRRPQLLNDCTAIEMDDVDKEKQLLDSVHWETSIGVVVLSFPRYCRYRGLLKRLEGVHNKWLRTALVVALGGFTLPCRNTRVLFCKDTFDYPDLEGHELLCNHLAPKLKGRPRKKRKIYSNTPEGSECESESSQSTASASSTKTKVSYPLEKSRNGLSPRRSTRGTGTIQEKEFLDKLFAFMKGKNNPITRIPSIGFKEIDLYSFYHKVQNLGGYDAVTAGRMWKYVYEELGGDQNSTSAATISRRHYERLLLPYERQHGGNHVTSKVKSKASGESSSAATCSASTSGVSSGAATPVTSRDIMTSLNLSSSVSITPSVTITPNLPPSKTDKEKRLSNKITSLRGIRLKPEKMLVDAGGGKENIPVSNSSNLSSKPDLSSELIDLCSEDSQSPTKGNVSVQPTLKKQKLEILKEGGLEVTPVTSSTAVSSSSGGGEEGRPSVIRHSVPDTSITDSSSENKASIRVPEMNRACLNIPEISRSKMIDSRSKTSSPDRTRSKISIMVTPDLPAMFAPPSAHTSNGASNKANSIIDKNGPQQRLYPSPPASPWAKRTIYGNPKDIIQPTIKRPVAEEVLDLRMKGVSESGGRSSTKSVLPNCHQIGSNLEITLVPSKMSGLPPAPVSSPLPAPHAPTSHRRKKSSPAPAHSFSNGHVEASRSPQLLGNTKQPSHSPNLYQSSLVIPNVSLSTNNNRRKSGGKKSTTNTASQQITNNFPMQFANFKTPSMVSPSTATALDSFYLSALFNNLLPATSTAAQSVFGPAQQLQLYKELYCRQLTSAASADPLPENFPRLLQDGSTSITLVANNSTPTSK
ncbi:uncharacterized protein LOC111045241 isoform X1 [Nilaparvata lugens]|uniref:uncharacterized protein LOC111045241 isoform X1 n=1 Tax=Nilaparvata lugens TaxID=108931 RepID=UPI00193E9601|nr:uncharacterized protein LOC111045241 isoform X1 [Nilaparvata lugens]